MENEVMQPKVNEAWSSWHKYQKMLMWFGLVLLLYVGTFGLADALRFVLYLLVLLAGFLVVVAHKCTTRSKSLLSADDAPLLQYDEPYCGLPAVFRLIEQSPQGYKFDRRLTGSSIIDEALQDVLNYFFRDFISGWYTKISDHERLLWELRQTIHKCIILFASRTKEVEWVPFLTTRLVDDFASHMRIFRITTERLEKQKAGDKGNEVLMNTDEEKLQLEVDLQDMFFTVESEVNQGLSHGKICLDDEAEQEYLQDICEVLLYLLLPPEDFHSKTARYFIKEIIASCVLLPTVNLVCEPDYVNQTISWLCSKEETLSVDSFLTTIKFSDDIDDVEETRKKVEMEIAKQRSHDCRSMETHESEINSKRLLNSLMYVRKLCIAKTRRLKSGLLGDTGSIMENDPEPDLLGMLTPHQNLPKMSLREILDDNTALSYFIEFMGGVNAEHYVFFYLTVEGFRATAIQQLTLLAEETTKLADQKKGQLASDFEQLKQAAANIYEEYISPRALPRIMLDDQLVRKIVKDIKNAEPSGSYFDAAEMQVLKTMENPKYYAAFLDSTSYIKCLMELDMLRSDATSDDDGELSVSSAKPKSSESISIPDRSVSDVPGNQLWTPDVDLRYSALITHAGIVNQGSKSFGVYSVYVCKVTGDGGQSWTVCRRYSDFHDLHMQLREKYMSLSWLNLPGKKTFGNMDQAFIEKRKNALESYLQALLDTNLLAENPGMFELMAGFLEMGEYYKGKSFFSRKIDHIVHPLKLSMSNVSNAIKSKSEDSESAKIPRDDKMESVFHGKLSDALCSEDDDNIPLRIMLLLMDEVFDLKHRNQWLRRRIVVILRQIIKTMFGDQINRKIVDYVDWATNSNQIAEYVKLFRDSYWPGGILCESAPERAADVCHRMRMITKARMIGSIPDDLKRFLGTENTREGVTRVFDMFQHENLNKRLFYVVFEAFLETVFPDNKFKEIFRRIHNKQPWKML